MKRHKEGNLPFANLPIVLKDGVNAFKTGHEKMIFLYGAIVTLSGLVHMIKGQYRQQRVYPNLFLFILAEFASGKSSLNYARKLVEKIHNEITQHSINELKLFNQLNKTKNGTSPAGMTKPPMRTVLIPANVTGAKFIEHLSANGSATPSIILESEIDTLTVAAKAEHGNFSDILRKGFHNEPVSYSRKGNSEFLEVSSPTFSLALAGTFNQFRKLITSGEDGLLSRFWVYQFSAPQRWSSVAPSENSLNLDELFERLSATVYDCYQHLKSNHLTILLTQKQWQRVDGFGMNNLHRCKDINGLNCAGIVKRHALMLYKACLTLTAIRMGETKNTVPSVYCSDDDFNLALWLCQQSLDSSLDLLASLPDSLATKGKRSKDELTTLLPLEFTRAEAINIAKQARLPERTTDRYLKELVKSNNLLWVANGKYRKP